VSIWLNQSCTEAARRGGAGCNNGCDVDCAFIAADMCDCSPLVVLDTPGLCGSDQASSVLSFVATVPAMSHLMDDADREGSNEIYIYIGMQKFNGAYSCHFGTSKGFAINTSLHDNLYV
jgi:hypothetical protein